MPRKPTARFVRHAYPSFYACYLLKSLAKTYTGKDSKTNYIGSTPDPPKRIRQHNGEISSGARKTSLRRPWNMQMIVHGFPSRMAALQFEWAWQHPYKARHLKDEEGKYIFAKTGRFLQKNILVARTMISSHPYNTMALHVKLFTEEAKAFWTEAGKSSLSPPLPQGTIVSVEFEGVDGKSGLRGLGRRGPIDVKDEVFTASHLRKNTQLIAANPQLSCFFCVSKLESYSSEPLKHVLCPHHKCTLTAHLTCMAQHFHQSTSSPLVVPRGGTCPQCDTYILWGDIIKGCYRRAAGGAVQLEDEEVEPEESDSEDDLPRTKTKAKAKIKTKSKALKTTRKPTTKGKKKVKNSSNSEGEHFDFDGIGSGDDSDDYIISPPLPPKKRGRPPKLPSSTLGVPRKGKGKAKATLKGVSSEGEHFDFDGIGSGDDSEDVAAPPPVKKRDPAAKLTASKKSGTKLTAVLTTEKRVVGRPRKVSSPTSRGLYTAATHTSFTPHPHSGDEWEDDNMDGGATSNMNGVLHSFSGLSLSSNPTKISQVAEQVIVIDISD